MPGVVLPYNETVGNTIPPDTPHVSKALPYIWHASVNSTDPLPQAVSVSLPTWEANVGYEKGESWVVDKMKCGYPRSVMTNS